MGSLATSSAPCTTLVITEQSTGSLDISLTNSTTAAGIGGAYYDPNGNDGDFSCGMVVINGGTITAAGRGDSAGIGGASYAPNFGNGGNITPKIGRCPGFAVVNPNFRSIQYLAGIHQFWHHDHVLGGIAVDGVGSIGIKVCTVRQGQIARICKGQLTWPDQRGPCDADRRGAQFNLWKCLWLRQRQQKHSQRARFPYRLS